MNSAETASGSRRWCTAQAKGFSLLEVCIAMAICGVLAAIAIPNMVRYRERARVIKAVGDIRKLDTRIMAFQIENGRLPNSLAELPPGVFLDPWGRPYQYTPVAGTPKGSLRKDRFLVPINSDYDLYSMGKDGKSQTPLTAAASRDDIIRANDGGFIGLASDY